MSGPRPAEKAASAFNKVLSLSGDQTEALEQAVWTFRGLCKATTDGLARLGLAHALLMLGRRAEAGSLADELWDRRASLPPAQRLNVAVLTGELGRAMQAAELADGAGSELGPAWQAQRASVIADAVLQSWDATLLRRYGLPPAPNVHDFVAAIDAIGLLPAMPARQALVHGILGAHQCGTHATIGTDGHSDVVLRRTVYVAGDRAARGDLVEQVSDATDRFYRAHGIDADEASWLVGEIVLPVSARPPVEQAALLAFA